ncbi:MAG: PKD domain-containing protein, partial [Chitinophagaceae bacterium]
MKKIIRLVATSILLLTSYAIFAQNISNKGKEFWVGYGHHQYMTFPTDNSQNMTIYLSAEEAATVTIEIDSSGLLPSQWWRRTYNIPANTVIDIANPATPAATFTTAALAWGPIPKGTVDAAASNTGVNYDARLVNDPPPAGNGGEGFFRKKGIHITSNVPIVAYAHIYGGVSSGATMLLPIESWGYAYTSINSNQGDAANSYNWVYVIARLNNTVIEINPSQTSQLGKPAGVPFQVTLNKGQIYQLQGQANAAGNGVNLTGTTVKVVANSSGVCNPIAVFSGSSRTINTACGGGGGRDNDMQQGFPQQTWGKRYLLAPLSQATSSTNIQASTFQTNPYRVVVRDPSTVVRRNGVIMTGLQANSFYYFESSQPELIEADKPIMVAQFMSGGCLNGLGDPEMIYVSPIEQGVKKTGFYRNTKEAINVNYVTIVVPTAGVPSLRIDNSATFNHQYVHPRDTRYTVVVKGWAASQAQSIISCDSAFTAVTYGLGGAESYGYNAGTYLNNLNAISDFYNSADTSRNTVKNHAFGFVNAPMEIGALIRYKPLSIRWKLSTLSSVLTPSADVFQNNPTPVDSVLIGGGWSYRYRLPGTYTFNTAGTYYIPIQLTSDVYGAGDCRNIEDISIEYIIKPFPTANFTFTVGACSSDSVAFTGPTVTAEGYKVLKWKWTFSSAPGDTSILQNPKAKLNTGNNSVKLDLVVEIGGLASVTKIVTVPGLVNVKFGASATNICIGQTVTFSDTTAGATINNWYWDFGDGKPGSVVNANSNVNQSYTYTTAGNFIAKHTVSITGGGSCIIDTIKIPITVSPKAYVDFTASSGCLPANGLANFTATSPTTGVSSFTWTFGDPASGAANMAIGSTASHNYNADGTYAVKLAVVTTSGCVGDTTKNLVFNRLPQITGTIGVVSVLCDNTPPVAISAPTIANGVSGTANWRSFKGGVVDPTMSNYNPAIAGYGSDTIYFKFTTVNSCTDSAKYPITVAARPRGNFTYLPASTTCISPTTPVNFTSNINVPNSSVLSYSWFFESPSVDPAKRSNLANPTYNYPEGTFLTMLSLTGANGCMFDTLQNIVVSKAPAISALTQGDICDNVAPFTIAAPSIGGSVTGTGVFKSFKNAITSNGLYSPLLAGVGVDTIYYVFTTSTGCVDSVKKHFTVLGTPRGNFSFSPSNGCLPTTGLVSFTNNIVVPGSSVANYLWQFESPLNTPSTTSSLPNPTYNYNEGPFTIKLSITGANGCLYDTSQNVIFGKKPAINPLVQASICENNGAITIATPAVTNSVGGSGVFRSFKNAFTNVLSGGYDPSIASYGVDTIYYRFTTTNNCTDSVKLPLQINARPRGIFTFSPSGCLDASGIVNFSNNISVVGSTISNYNWKFESPSNAPANISSASNPSHVYNVGTFKIDLNTVASNGCSFDTTQTVTFGKKPSIAPLIVSNVCESVAPFNFTAPNILNSVSGVGVFSSFKGASNAAGLYNPSIAGYGVDTVYYKFTTGVDCFDSVKAPITIQARPRATFTISPTGCLNASGTASFTSNAFVPNSSVSTYAWQFESPLNTVATTSNLPNPTYNYNTDGTYTIKLTVTGANNCSFDTSVTRLFS